MTNLIYPISLVSDGLLWQNLVWVKSDIARGSALGPYRGEVVYYFEFEASICMYELMLSVFGIYLNI
jgi:hypothetical protein